MTAEEKIRLSEFKKEYNISLDSQQEEAAFSDGRHILLLAVPGSGKTTVMIARLGYLTRVRNVAPTSILAITYSVAGANEMKKRYTEKFGDDGVEIRTIHSFCVNVINEYCNRKGTRAFRMLSDDEGQENIIRRILSDTGGYPSDNDIRDTVTAIAYSVNAMLTDDEIKELTPLEGRDFSEIYRKYREFKREKELMDFDDQLKFAYTILNTYPEICEFCTSRFSHICVDEAQDTSLLQHKILRKITEGRGNLFMVGDEDQSIYGFRAASPEELTEFEKIYSDAEIYYIENNYRSTSNIVSVAQDFISCNTLRKEKHMTTGNEAGEKIRRTKLNDLSELPEYICDIASTGMGIAVLARLNDSLVPIIDALSMKEIDFSLRGRDSLFFTHYIINDIKNLLAFGDNPYDYDLFSKIYYKLSLGLSKKDLERARTHNYGDYRDAYLDYISKSTFFADRIRTRCGAAARGFRRLSGESMPRAMEIILNDCGYGTYMKDHPNEAPKIAALMALARNHPSKADFLNRLDELKEIVKNGANGEGIVLSTIHSAKGMEFDHVILIDCRNGILPNVPQRMVPSAPENEKARDEIRKNEEDRRLFYVGMTRAKNILEVIICQKIFGEVCNGADFVDYIAEKSQELGLLSEKSKKHVAMSLVNVGTRIKHNVFGIGVVVGYANVGEDVIANVRFPTFEKKLNIKICVERKIIQILEN